jgi:hypothetical protein
MDIIHFTVTMIQLLRLSLSILRGRCCRSERGNVPDVLNTCNRGGINTSME